MEVLRLLAPVGRFVSLTIAQMLQMWLGFVLLLTATESTQVMRGTFVGGVPILFFCLSPASSCTAAVGG